MSKIKSKSLGKNFSIAMFSLALALGIGTIFAPKASADDGHNGHHESDRSVSINGHTYDVRHNNNGPYITFDGKRYYLEGSGSDRFVTINGKRYDVNGEEHRDHRDRHEGDRHHEGDHHEGDHHRGDHHHNHND